MNIKNTAIAIFSVVFCIACVSNGTNNTAGKKNNASFYVSLNGEDEGNNGMSEETPFRTLKKAVASAIESSIKTITVIGILDTESEEADLSETPCIFSLSQPDNSQEILITGKPGANANEKAVLTSNSTGKTVVQIDGGTFRFENIEITRGGRSGGAGISIKSGSVTLGPGTLVHGIATGGSVNLGQGTWIRGFASYAVNISGGTCIIDGGEVKENQGGVLVAENGRLIMRSGAINLNKETRGGGVLVDQNAVFTMYGGAVTNNISNEGGGVYVWPNGKFEQSSGSITGNYADIGGGVFVSPNGVFNQTGGIIGDNKVKFYGGGVLVDKGATFTMSGGGITVNMADNGGGVAVLANGKFDLKGGTINENGVYSYGGGVLVDKDAVFTMTRGSITDNVASKGGGGVAVQGTFIQTGGMVSNNLAETGDNVLRTPDSRGSNF